MLLNKNLFFIISFFLLFFAWRWWEANSSRTFGTFRIRSLAQNSTKRLLARSSRAALKIRCALPPLPFSFPPFTFSLPSPLFAVRQINQKRKVYFLKHRARSYALSPSSLPPSLSILSSLLTHCAIGVEKSSGPPIRSMRGIAHKNSSLHRLSRFLQIFQRNGHHGSL